MARNDSTYDTDVDTHGARMRIPRSRGAVSGFLLMLLGAWGALAPLIGPYVHFGFTPDTAWHISSGRFWLQILPGAVAVVGGFLLLTAANRVMTSFGAWLGVAAGVWFVINTPLGTLFNLGSVGAPIATSKAGKAIQFLLLFDGLGALIIFIAATALGRLGVVSVRDVQAARRRQNEDHDDDRDDEPVRRTVREVPVVDTAVVRTYDADTTTVRTPTRPAESVTRHRHDRQRAWRPAARPVTWWWRHPPGRRPVTTPRRSADGGEPVRSTSTPEDAAVLAGAEVEHAASEPTAAHHPRTEPASPAEKQVLDDAITAAAEPTPG